MDDLFGKVQGKSKVDSRSADSINPGSLNVAARASMVNRTHRIVRERAGQMSSRRNRIRSLMAPLAISAVMLVILVTAVWTLLDEYELNPTGFVDSSDQYLVLALWFLPLSLALLGMVWWTRTRGRRSGSEFIQ
jgi:protein-S-isoprenylcysteine O-methyltransferase Ste14